MTNKEKQKEKLTDLIIESVDGCARHWAEIIADYLLQNGVIVPPCTVFEKHRITVDDLYNSGLDRYTKIKVFSAYNGKELCEEYKPSNKRHIEIGNRIICSIWPSFDWVKNYVYGTPAHSLNPILCCSVVGDVECQQEFAAEQALKERDDVG